MDIPSTPEIISPLNRAQRRRYVSLLDRFDKYSARPHIEALKQKKRELDQLKKRKDRRNILVERMEAARLLQQIRVDLANLAGIKDQALCPEDQDVYESRGEPLRVRLIRAAAEIVENHPEVKRPAQEQEDVLLSPEEKEQGYAPAADEMAREEDRIADQKDLLLRVEAIQTDIAHAAGMMDQFWTILEAQGKTTSTIEAHIADAEAAVIVGTAELALAAQYKVAMYPVAGAIIGGFFAGPLGLLSGIKLAGLVSAAAGSFIGYQGGNVIKRRSLLTIPVKSEPREASDIPAEDPKKTD